jgi:hypothetical protein
MTDLFMAGKRYCNVLSAPACPVAVLVRLFCVQLAQVCQAATVVDHLFDHWQPQVPLPGAYVAPTTAVRQ